MGIKVDQKIGLNSSKQYYMICELPEHLYIQLEDIFLFRGPSVRSKNTLITGRVRGKGICKSGPFVSAEGCKYQSVHLYPEIKVLMIELNVFYEKFLF